MDQPQTSFISLCFAPLLVRGGALSLATALIGLASPFAFAQPGVDLTQHWHQDVAGLNDLVESFDGFGRRLAVGDFDGDGWDDVAISAPSETLEGSPTYTAAGVVHVLYGTAAGGLNVAGAQRWSFQSPALAVFAQNNALFGSELVVGNFDNDLYDDLVIGASRYDAPGVLDAGAVFVLRGTASGLSGSIVLRVWEADAAVIGDASAQDRFGDGLGAGDLNGDMYDDLAVGISGQASGDESNAGAVMVLYGSMTGLSLAGEQVFDQTHLGDTPNGDDFGRAVLVGHLDSDVYEDLALGAPEVDFDDGDTFLSDVGVVYIVPGSAAGIDTGSSMRLHQDQAGVLDEREQNDRFGASLAGLADSSWPEQMRLAVGVYGEDGEDGEDGMVHLFGVSAGGPSTSGQELLFQDSADSSEPLGFSAFGEALATADLDGDGSQELIVGAPSEDGLLTPGANGGAAQVFFGGGPSGSMDLSRFLRFWEDAAPIHGETAATEEFGASLASGDFNGDGLVDLVIGAPSDRSGPSGAVLGGGVYVLYGAADATLIFSDGFESGDTASWLSE